MFALGVAAIGCGKPTPIAPAGSADSNALRGTDKPNEKVGDVAVEKGVQADEILYSGIRSLTGGAGPDDFNMGLKQVNQYLARKSDAVESLDSAAKARISSLLGPAAAVDAERKEFADSDAEYLRNTLFLQTVAAGYREAGGDDLELAQRLFDWVVREVQLVPAGWQVEGPPLEVAVRGTGNPAERSWIFLELLRQAGLAGCVVGIPGAAEGAIDPWLCGLLSDGDIHLFDPLVGLPAPGRKRPIATLAELAADPKLLDAFTVDPKLPYPIAASRAQGFSLLLVLQSAMLSPRMKFLEKNLSGDERANLTSDFEAVLAKATAALSKIPGQQGVRVWLFPQRVLEQTTADRAALLRTINMTWLLGPKSARMLALEGKHQEAVEAFVQMDLQNLRPDALARMMMGNRSLSPERRARMASQTWQDVLYFGALCQLSRPRAEPRIARAWLDRYRERFPNARVRDHDAFAWSALCAKLQASSEGPGAVVAKRMAAILPGSGAMARQAGRFFEELGKFAAQYASSQAPDIEAAKGKLAELVPAWNVALEAVAKDPKLAKSLEAALAKAKSLPLDLAHARTPEELFEFVGKVNIDVMVALLNRVVEDPSFYDAAAFAELLRDPPLEGGLANLLAIPADRRTPDQVMQINRTLLDAGLFEVLALGVPVWTMGAIQQGAQALLREGKLPEATALLRRGHPQLVDVQRLALLATAAAWERNAARDAKSASR